MCINAMSRSSEVNVSCLFVKWKIAPRTILFLFFFFEEHIVRHLRSFSQIILYNLYILRIFIVVYSVKFLLSKTFFFIYFFIFSLYTNKDAFALWTLTRVSPSCFTF